MQLRTHLKIDQEISGTPVEVGEGYAVVELKTKENMRADEKNLVHGGFIFSLADYCAMRGCSKKSLIGTVPPSLPKGLTASSPYPTPLAPTLASEEKGLLVRPFQG
jgi:acyl-coenzyme A thioesterase PaaI-like protein